MTDQIKAMKKLGLTDEEIKAVLADDKKIDKGEKLFPLTEEQEKISKQARQAERKPTVYKFSTREKKHDNDKQFLIDTIVDNLRSTGVENIEIANAEREFTFVYNNKKYKIVLSVPRS
jgi:DNA-binding transcriptional MerR regulator